ncbi:MAG: DUF1523 family protein [Desulfobacterales bacterium]
MNALKKVKLIVGLLLLVVLMLFLHYNLPRTAVVQISGTDMKRSDKSSRELSGQEESAKKRTAALQTVDVRFVNTVSRDGEVMVFRNEDTGWGWPPYFKFDSADVTAMAQAFAIDPNKPWVRVKYYGWRIRMFSMFPNVISLKSVPKDSSHFPLFNVTILLLLAGSGVWLTRRIKGLSQRLKQKKES